MSHFAKITAVRKPPAAIAASRGFPTTTICTPVRVQKNTPKPIRSQVIYLLLFSGLYEAK